MAPRFGLIPTHAKGALPDCGGFASLRIYVTSMKEADHTADALQAAYHYIDGCYGVAAADMKAFFDVSRQEPQRRDWVQYCEQRRTDFMTKDFSLACLGHLDAAEAKARAAADAGLLYRILKEKQCVLWSYLNDTCPGRGKVPDEDFAAWADRLAEFCQVARMTGNAYIGSTQMDTWFDTVADYKVTRLNNYTWTQAPEIDRLIANPVKALTIPPVAIGDYYISSDLGDDSNDGTTMATAFKTLEAVFGADGQAKGRLAEKRTIVLSNGTYALNAPLRFSGTKLKGWTGHPWDVVLDGQDKTNCVVMNSGTCLLTGVTVRRGKPWGPFVNLVFHGASGVYVGNSSSMVTNCIVRDCTQAVSGSTFNMGGGVMVVSGKVVDTHVENCHAICPSGCRGYGGGICLYGSDTSAIDCTVTNCSIVGSSEAYGGGIGNYFEGYDVAVTGCAVYNCASTNTTGGLIGTGGGISVTPGGKVRDCLVRNCKGAFAQLTAVGRNGADYDAHRTLISGCTIEGGVCRPLYLGSSYQLNNATVENMLIRDTTLTPGSSLTGYAVYVNGSGNRFLSSVVRNCQSVGKKGSHAVYLAGSNVLVSNCVVDSCKTALNETDGPTYSAAIAGNYSLNLQIIDTIVQSNESYRASSLYTYGNAGTATGLVVRGCYFFANKSANACGIYACENRPHIFDHCTFACNGTGDAYFRATGFNGLAATNWFVNACVFVGGNTPFDVPTGGVYPISYCNVATEGGTRGSPNTITRTCFSSGMKYVNSSAKDYRQTKDSAGVDVDSSSVMSYDWMLGGRKRRDMGDGRYTLLQVGKYGVSVVHPNAVRRISGTHPDIGCFEYRHKTGFALFLQ